MAMKIVRWFLLFSIICIFFLSNSSSVQGRYHFHRSRRSSSSPSGTSSSPPPTSDPNSNPSPTYPPPEPPSSNDPISDPSPTYPPPEPPSSSDPNSNPCVFNVMSYGAVGDGETDDTAAFKSAWDDACSVESGVLLAPSNYVFMITSTIFSGPCKQGLTFQVDGVLMAPNGPDCWPESDSKRQWLVFYQVHGMTLQGSGVIEGNGEKWWDLPCKPHKGPNGSTLPGPCDSPTAIRFFVSSDITVRGLHFQNSPQFHVKFDACENVLIDTVFINSPALSPNTDGIHIENTKSVGIYNSAISNGDDCISIGPGCADVDIENVTCGPSHGISIGSLGVHNSHACVSNVTVTNAVIRNSDNGVRIKTWQGGMGSVSEITFENVFMENVRNCIIIDQYYCFTKGCTNQTAAVFVTDVYYTNIKGTYDVRSPPIHFACSDTRPCVNITLAEVELLPSLGEMILDPFCWNAYGALETVTIPPVDCLQDAPQSFTETSSTYGC